MNDSDSGDCSDDFNRPSCSSGAGRNYARSCNEQKPQKRNRRIVMRIEFDDDDGSSDGDSSDNGFDGRVQQQQKRNKSEKELAKNGTSGEDSDAFHHNAAQRLRNRRTKLTLQNKGIRIDDSSSGSEINQIIKQRGTMSKRYVLSDNEIDVQPSTSKKINNTEDVGFSSDSSSNELLEKCPICLLTFRQQEIGTPATCEHMFCAGCIEAWSRNVQTCPIDRLEFEKIIVRESYENQRFVREISVNAADMNKNPFDDDIIDASQDEFTNCEICNSPEREDVMLLCDSCNQGYHIDCLDPPLSAIPEGSWYCDNCFNSHEDGDDSDDMAEDLTMLYEDIQDMGIPETRLRVREIQQPRIVRTRQNERLRAAIMRRTRSSTAESTTTRTVTSTTTTTTTTARTTRRNGNRRSACSTSGRKRRTRTRHRTYVVEYDLNNYDEKFAIKTTRKVIRRRRRKARSSRRASKSNTRGGTRLTASQRLAEQMGVKVNHTRSLLNNDAVPSLSLFGRENDLEYFSDSNCDEVVEDIENGHIGGTAVQTSVRISSIGAPRSRKALLLSKVQSNNSIRASNASATTDILSNIMEMQDRWHNAARNMSEVHINQDGTLNFPDVQRNLQSSSCNMNGASKTPTQEVNEAPMYPRGSGPKFGGGRGGGGGGNNVHNNRYRGAGNGGGSGNHYHQRNSTGSSTNNSGASDGFIGNQSNNQNDQVGRNSNFSPFNIRFNPRNQNNSNQRNNQQQQRQSLPFNRPNNEQQHNFSRPPHMEDGNQLFAGLPPPTNQIPQNTSHIIANAPPIAHGPGALHGSMTMPPILSVPPPPAPPCGIQPWNSAMFKLNTDYGNQVGDDNDEDSNCPNFSVYSQESQAVAQSADSTQSESAAHATKDDDDINEDLVQLDDDDEIPMPPEDPPKERNDGEKDLYEPENPTDENDHDIDTIKHGELETNAKDKDKDDTAETENIEQPIICRRRGGSEQYDPEEDNTNSTNVENTNEKSLDDENDNTTEIQADSPALQENERGGTAENRKGVLELYDDSDWEELEIDKPKDYEKAVLSRKNESRDQDGAVDDKAATPSNANNDLDRSYTPCLDEKNEENPEDNHEEGELRRSSSRSSSAIPDETSNKSKEPKKASEQERVGDIETELISDEDEINDTDHKDRSRSKHRRNDSKSKRRSSKRGRDNVETFKKVGNRQKGRNYRGDKQQTNDRRSQSRSISRSRSRSRSTSGSRSPIRRRTRTGSRSRSPRSRSPRSRNRHFNRDNFRGRGGYNRGRFNYRINGRYAGQNHYAYRQKRREIPRYDVRNVVGNQRAQYKDRYGRDTQRQRRSRSQTPQRRRQRSRSFSRSQSRSQSRSLSSKRARSFSISPSLSPPAGHNRQFDSHRRNSLSPRRFSGRSPAQQRSNSPPHRRTTPLRVRSQSPLQIRSRSNTPLRINGRKVGKGKRGRESPGRRSPIFSPRYTPRLSRSRSKTPKKTKRKKKIDKKRKKKKRVVSESPAPRNRRLSRQRDPFNDTDDMLLQPQHKKRRHSSKTITSDLVTAPNARWSPSPSLSPARGNFLHEVEKNNSWTPPLRSPRTINDEFLGAPNIQQESPQLSKKEKRKRNKKKKQKSLEKREIRKEKRRKQIAPHRTQTPEPPPSKEVFASGGNILVSVCFNKDAQGETSAQQQTTVVTLPPTREDILTNRRISIDRLTNNSISKKSKTDKTRKRKKLDAKPVAFIDLERSPFQVHQEPADVIVLTDSEDANEMTGRRERNRRSASLSEHDLRDRDEHHRIASSVGTHDKTPPVERMDTILETSYENMTQTTASMMTGPKTPPEPPIVKFNLPAKKQHKMRTNPLHDDADDMNSDGDLETREIRNEEQQAHEALSSQKIGPNTPPESGPCSPDAYDPFEPTKSPSLSPRSPTPPIAIDTSANSINDIGGVSDVHTVQSTQKHSQSSEETASGASNSGTQNTSINPVDLVMALMNSKSSNSNEISNKTNDAQYSGTNMLNSANVNSTEEKIDEAANSITVLSNVLISSAISAPSAQHIPIISSPTTSNMVKKLLQMPNKPTPGSIGSSSGINQPSTSANLRNGSGGGGSAGMDDSFNNIDIESPYSPGSADYEDLFEPPPENTSSRRNKRGGTTNATGISGKTDMFDNLFGSSSPVGGHRISSGYPAGSKKTAISKNERKSKIKVGKSNDDHIKVYDDVPNSAVELQVKDKFLRKLNRQERVVEEVKLVLKPHFNKKAISKEDYKDIMRRAVPKICHSRSGEINPHKIKNLIDAYVKKFRAKHKKLNPLNTGQVSSAVKCAAYLKKL